MRNAGQITIEKTHPRLPKSQKNFESTKISEKNGTSIPLIQRCFRWIFQIWKVWCLKNILVCWRKRYFLKFWYSQNFEKFFLHLWPWNNALSKTLQAIKFDSRHQKMKEFEKILLLKFEYFQMLIPILKKVDFWLQFKLKKWPVSIWMKKVWFFQGHFRLHFLYT